VKIDGLLMTARHYVFFAVSELFGNVAWDVFRKIRRHEQCLNIVLNCLNCIKLGCLSLT